MYYALKLMVFLHTNNVQYDMRKKLQTKRIVNISIYYTIMRIIHIRVYLFHGLRASTHIVCTCVWNNIYSF